MGMHGLSNKVMQLRKWLLKDGRYYSVQYMNNNCGIAIRIYISYLYIYCYIATVHWYKHWEHFVHIATILS